MESNDVEFDDELNAAVVDNPGHYDGLNDFDRENWSVDNPSTRIFTLMEAARSFIGTVEFYKSEFGGGKPHDEAVKEALQCHEWRRGYIEGISVERWYRISDG